MRSQSPSILSRLTQPPPTHASWPTMSLCFPKESIVTSTFRGGFGRRPSAFAPEAASEKRAGA